MNLRERVRDWPDATVKQIVDDWHQFEADGHIGDCELRRQAQLILAALGRSVGVTTWMREIAFEVFRRLALEKQR